MQTKRSSTQLFILTVATFTIILMVATMLYFKLDSTTEDNTENNTITTLNGPWKFKTGDNQQWAQPDVRDTDWETVDLTAPPGAHDGDVGISGYMPGWTSKGHATYSGYAWYRITVSLDTLTGKSLALLAPPAVDDAYQVFANGKLLGSAGDFSGTVPVVYSIQPRMFLLSEDVTKQATIVVAFRVWMRASSLAPEAGGIHVAPVLGEESKIESRYRFQWQQSVKGYIVEVVEPVIFVLLAITLFVLRKKKTLLNICSWFIAGLILLALLRLNQAVFYWFQVEDVYQQDILITVVIRPLILGCWLMAWWKWFELDKPKWLPKIIAALTLIYMVTQLLALPWILTSLNHSAFQTMADDTRWVFFAVMLFIFYQAVVKHGWKNWLTLLAMLLLVVSIFSQEVSAFHVPGIWFPYGVGVSRTQYVYAAFVVVMYLVLIQKDRNATGRVVEHL